MIRAFVLLPFAFFLIAALNATEPQQYRSGVDLITIPVTVTGHGGSQPRGELTAADFRLFEDGVRQEIAIVSHQPRALSLFILLDSSPSMASGRQPLAIRAIDTLLAHLKRDDEAALSFFARQVRVAFPWTSAPALQPVSWLEWRLSLGTALIDALKEGLRQVEHARNPLPVILVISDGGENSSGTPLARLIATRRQSETLIYGIQTDLAPSKHAPPLSRAFTNFLPDVVGDSGGTIHRVRTVEEAESAAHALLEELRAQYTLGFTSTSPPDGEYRTLKVETVSPALTVRHRAGYRAVNR